MAPELGLEQRLGQAMQWLERGQLEQAASALEQLVAEGLQSADLFGILADIRSRQERYDDAVQWGKKALSVQNKPAVAISLLGYLLDAEQQSAALSLGESLTRSGELTGWGWALLCRARRANGRLDAASEAIEQALQMAPQSARVQNEQGELFQQQVRPQETMMAFQRATQLDPKMALAWANLGKALAHRGDQVGGIAEVHKALQLDPASTAVRLRASTAFLHRGHLDLARRTLEPVLRRHPAHAEARSVLANVEERQGHYAAARAVVQPLLQGASTPSNVVLSYARSCLRLGDAQEALDCVEQALTTQRSPGGRRLLYHLMGNALARLKRYGEAVEAHGRANALLERDYDPAHFQAECTAVIEAYSSKSWPDLPRAQTATPQTILIVGMPRSGTSLVEQILASHPQVMGLGELPEMRLVSILIEKMTDKKPWHQQLSQLSPEQVESLGRWYCERTAQRVQAQGGAADSLLGIVDKMPSNTLFVGLAAQIMPGLRIIHTRRNPLDSCLSCYTQAFSEGLAYTTRFDWLGAYYRDQERLMDHWKTLLPGTILDVSYEALVTDPEPLVRRLLDHCGLDWDPAVLEFHQSGREVNTASYHQVRKPLYTSSVNKHTPYLPWLGELVEALEAGD